MILHKILIDNEKKIINNIRIKKENFDNFLNKISFSKKNKIIQYRNFCVKKKSKEGFIK